MKAVAVIALACVSVLARAQEPVSPVATYADDSEGIFDIDKFAAGDFVFYDNHDSFDDEAYHAHTIPFQSGQFGKKSRPIKIAGEDTYNAAYAQYDTIYSDVVDFASQRDMRDKEFRLWKSAGPDNKFDVWLKRDLTGISSRIKYKDKVLELKDLYPAGIHVQGPPGKQQLFVLAFSCAMSSCTAEIEVFPYP